MKLAKRIKHRISIIWRTSKFLYALNFKVAAIKDISFLITTVLNIVQIGVLGKFIDATATVLTEHQTLSLKDYFLTQSFETFAILTALVVTTRSLKRVYKYYSDSLMFEIYYRPDTVIIDKLAHLNLQEVEDAEFQNLLTYVPLFSIHRLVTTHDTAIHIVQHLIRFVMSISMLYVHFGPIVFVIPLLAIPEPITQYYRARQMEQFKTKEVHNMKLVDYLLNTIMFIPNFAELRINRVFNKLRTRFENTNRKYYNKLKTLYQHYYIDQNFFSIFDYLMLMGFVLFMLLKAISKQLTIGTFKAQYDYAQTVHNASYNIFDGVEQLFNNTHYVEKFFELLDYQGFGDVEDSSGRLPKGTPVVEATDLVFRYHGEKTNSLDNISFRIEPGSRVAFVGYDNAGKSTLVKVLCGLYQITEGDILLDGHTVKKLARGEHKNKISAILQDFVRYNFTFEEAVTMGNRNKTISRPLYREVLKITELDRYMKEEGLTDKQVLGKYFKNGKEVPPAIWQKIAIARMLYNKKNLLIMDEPFTYIDSTAERRLLKGIFKFAKKHGLSVLYFSQDMTNLDIFDHVYYMKRGKIVDSGNYKKLVKERGAFRKDILSDN